MSAVHVADTGLFVAMGRPDNVRYRAVRRVARRDDIQFVVPRAVYAELTVPDRGADPPPIDVAIESGWVSIADPLSYEASFVSRSVDGVRRHIANATDRPEDEIERADASLAGVVAQAFRSGSASEAVVYTTDVAAGRAIEAVFASEGYGDSVTVVDGFRFVEDLIE